jgi:hypothetical protein
MDLGGEFKLFCPKFGLSGPTMGPFPETGRSFEAGRRAERSGKKLKASVKSPNPPRARVKKSLSAIPIFKILKKVKLSA